MQRSVETTRIICPKHVAMFRRAGGCSMQRIQVQIDKRLANFNDGYASKLSNPSFTCLCRLLMRSLLGGCVDGRLKIRFNRLEFFNDQSVARSKRIAATTSGGGGVGVDGGGSSSSSSSSSSSDGGMQPMHTVSLRNVVYFVP
ncbi:ABC transporter B family member [Trichinella pseudospiralis]